VLPDRRPDREEQRRRHTHDECREERDLDRDVLPHGDAGRDGEGERPPARRHETCTEPERDPTGNLDRKLRHRWIEEVDRKEGADADEDDRHRKKSQQLRPVHCPANVIRSFGARKHVNRLRHCYAARDESRPRPDLAVAP